MELNETMNAPVTPHQEQRRYEQICTKCSKRLCHHDYQWKNKSDVWKAFQFIDLNCTQDTHE